MADSALGGRSSATPRSHTQETQSSLLPRLKARRPDRKIPAHFPPLDSGFRSVIIYLTVCVQQKKPLLANRTAARLIVDAWGAATYWCAGRTDIINDPIHFFS